MIEITQNVITDKDGLSVSDIRNNCSMQNMLNFLSHNVITRNHYLELIDNDEVDEDARRANVLRGSSFCTLWFRHLDLRQRDLRCFPSADQRRIFCSCKGSN